MSLHDHERTWLWAYMITRLHDHERTWPSWYFDHDYWHNLSSIWNSFSTPNRNICPLMKKQIMYNLWWQLGSLYFRSTTVDFNVFQMELSFELNSRSHEIYLWESQLSKNTGALLYLVFLMVLWTIDSVPFQIVLIRQLVFKYEI